MAGLTKIKAGALHDDCVTAGNYADNSITGDHLDHSTALPDGVTATTQSAGDNSTKVATTAYADAAGGDSDKIEEGNTAVECVDTGSNGTITFDTDGNERMRIDSSGNVGIGTTAPGSLLQVGKSDTDGGSTNLTIARGEAITGGTGPVLTFKHGPDSGTQRTHHIYSKVGDLWIDVDDNENFQIHTGGSERVRVHTDGKVSFNDGICLGNAHNGDASNTLDDYEEGTYTVSLTSGSGSITLNSSQDTFAYTKIGRLVHIQGFITVSSTSSPSGSLSFNLPVNANLSMSEQADNGHMPIICNGTAINCDQYAAAYNNTTSMSIVTTSGSTPDSGSVADLFGSGDNIVVSFNYLASS